MKCPKCGYLGFEPVDRCRNCGYEFSLASPAADLELPLRPTPTSADRVGTGADGLASPGELPLFGAPIADDVPLITKASPPRPPLSVRRATPDVPRVRTVAPRTTTLDLGFEASPPESAAESARPTPGNTPDRSSGPAEDATLGARLLAVILDGVILGAIDVVVVYFTLQICGVGLDEWRVLPWAPLAAFIVLQNGGYLVGFTAGGQTLGKMAAGIKVISAESRSSIDVSRALVRELTWFALAIPAGLGLLSTVFSRDHRGLHDRFAGTRVVRATL